MNNFSFDTETREFLSNSYPVGIFDDNIITAVEVGKPEDGSAYLDITFENVKKGYTLRERIFAVDRVPDWSTEEKEINKLKAKIKHIMARFVPEDQMIFEAHGFIDMCEKVKERLDQFAVAAKARVSLITEYDRNFTYVVLKSKYPPFLANENDKPLAYSEAERRRNFPEEFEIPSIPGQDDTDAPVIH